MALIDKLTAIANAIRSKSGKTATLTLDEMPTEIAALSAEEQLKASEYPYYISPEVVEVVNKVNSVRHSDSIVFVAMSDSHYCADQVIDFYETETNASTIQANQAAKVLAYLLNVDFFAHLGDVSCGANTTTPDMLKEQIEGFISYFREAKSDLPVFICIGNHDAGIYYHDVQTDGNIHTMTGEYLYNNFTAHSESDDTVVGGEEYGGYCYRDFADKKLRVIMLNTSEKLVGAQIDNTTYGAQRLWLANALLDLNSKADATEWGFIILSHYPADYGATMPLSQLLEAYVKGSSVTITDPANSDYYKGDGTSQTVSFAGKNSAKFVAQFHGHIHNFLYSKLYSNASGSAVQYDAWRMCIPNGQFNRENTYGTVSNISFAEDKKYTKIADTANGTSFVVNVINPSEEKIYSFCYGAGYDRIIGFGSVVYYSVTRTLANVTTNNTILSVENGKSFSETITLTSGCDMKTITVTMGGVDITSTAVTIDNGNYQIDIAEVTGNIVITAKAEAIPNFTNLVPTSVASDGTSVYNGTGYKNGYKLNTAFDEAAATGMCVTGFIPIEAVAMTIRVAGDGISCGTNSTIVGYDEDFNAVSGIAYNNMGVQHSNGSYYNGVLIDEASTALTLQLQSVSNIVAHKCKYIRVCTYGDGANLIVTIDEEITYGGTDDGSVDVSYFVWYNLTNVTSSNTATSVPYLGGSYSTTLTANSGYELESVIVKMGGVDVTSSVYSNGVVSIPQVTGSIDITAIATAVQASYTNQLPISTDTDGSVYNGTGYKADTYISGGTVATRSGVYTSGFIPCKAGDTLYFKNVTLQDNQSNHRFTYYNSSKTYVTNAHWSTTNDNSVNIVITYGSDGNIATMTIPTSSSYGQQVGFIRFCCGGLDATSIVTVNEPIE